MSTSTYIFVSGHMWECQVLLMDGQVLFSPGFSGFHPPLMNDRLDVIKLNILDRVVNPPPPTPPPPKKKKKKKKKKNQYIVVEKHYKKKPIQINRKFHLQKNSKFSDKKTLVIFIFLQKHRGGSNEYPQSKCFEQN